MSPCYRVSACRWTRHYFYNYIYFESWTNAPTAPCTTIAAVNARTTIPKKAFFLFLVIQHFVVQLSSHRLHPNNLVDVDLLYQSSRYLDKNIQYGNDSSQWFRTQWLLFRTTCRLRLVSPNPISPSLQPNTQTNSFPKLCLFPRHEPSPPRVCPRPRPIPAQRKLQSRVRWRHDGNHGRDRQNRRQTLLT